MFVDIVSERLNQQKVLKLDFFAPAKFVALIRRDAGVVERARLESWCTRKGTEGSNPSLSALYIRHYHPSLPRR